MKVCADNFSVMEKYKKIEKKAKSEMRKRVFILDFVKTIGDVVKNINQRYSVVVDSY